MNDNTQSLIADLNNSLREFSNALDKETRSVGLVNDALRKNEKESKDAKEAQKKLSQSIQSGAKSVLGFASSLQNGQGSFEPLTQIVTLTTKAFTSIVGEIPIVGGALAGFLGATKDTINLMITTYDKVYSSFEKLSDTGVVESFDTLRTISMTMGTTMSGASEALQKRSKELALFGGSAVQGTKMMQMVTMKSDLIRDDFQKLGISSQEFIDFQIGYINQQNLYNMGKKKTTDELVQESTNYIKELDAISKLTGESRKELQKKREERQNEATILVGMQKLAPKMQDEFMKYYDIIEAKAGKQMAQGSTLMMMRAGRVVGDASSKVQAGMPEAAALMAKAFDELQSGTFDAEKTVKLVAQSAKEANKRYESLALLRGSETQQTALTVERNKLATSVDKDLIKLDKDYRNTQDKTLKDQDSDNAKLAGSKRNLERTQINLEQLATSSDTALYIMDEFSESLEKLTAKLYSSARLDVPENLKASSEVRKAMKEEVKARNDIIKAEKERAENIKKGVKFTKDLEDTDVMKGLRKKLEETIKKKEDALEKKKQADIKAGVIIGGATETSRSSSGQAVTSTASTSVSKASALGEDLNAINPNVRSQASGKGAGQSFPDSSQVPPKLTTIRSKTGASTQVNTKGAAQFQQMIDWFDSIGYPIKSLGGYADRSIAGTNIPSWHSAGMAIDINPGQNPMGTQRITDMPETPDKNTGQKAASLGLGWGANWPNKKDAMHFSLGPNEGGHINSARTGGIFDGPDSGYLTELHGDEIVAPVGKEALNTSMLSGIGEASSNIDFDKLYNQMSNKMDDLISAMQDNMQASKKQIMSKFT